MLSVIRQASIPLYTNLANIQIPSKRKDNKTNNLAGVLVGEKYI